MDLKQNISLKLLIVLIIGSIFISAVLAFMRIRIQSQTTVVEHKDLRLPDKGLKR